MHKENGGAVGQAVEVFGWVVLLALLVAVVWVFGLTVWLGISELLLGRRFGSIEVILPGVELAIVPLTAVAAARLRFGADRILALRGSHVGPWLPLLMAASLVGLFTYLAWTWRAPQSEFVPELEFGPLRWLGIMLAAGITWVWTPLFPRVTATLAGMFAGPALFATVAFPFLGSCMSVQDANSSEDYSGLAAIYLGSLATIVWVFGAHYLLQAWVGEAKRLDGRPFYFAAWSGAIMLGMALLGALVFIDC